MKQRRSLSEFTWCPMLPDFTLGLSEDSIYNIHDGIRQEQRKRLQHLQNTCADKDVYRKMMYKRHGRNAEYHYSSKYNFSYCRVPKAGCTVLAQIFAILEATSTLVKIFSMNRRSLHTKLGKDFKVAIQSEARRNSRTVLISRDPYARLFSAFIDKMFLPVPFYHKAVDIVRRQRKNNSSCAIDITFEEFLKDIIDSVRKGEKLNMHWNPIVNICRPCEVNAFALVKLETFTPDVEYVLKEVGTADNEFEVIKDALHDHRIETTLPGLLKDVINTDVEQCMDRMEVARRIWETFQIQGYINDDIPFPTKTIDTNEKARNPDFLMEVVLETIRKHPMAPEDAKLQRRRALVKAFDGLSKDILDQIKKLYKQDFILFDYSSEPPTM